MKLAYLDCFSGVSGDMFLAALLHAGAPEEEVRNMLSRLPLQHRLRVEKVTKAGVTALAVAVEAPEVRIGGYEGFCRLLQAAGLPPEVELKSRLVLERLARAEARVHGVPLEQVHFHELDAADTVVDVVGTVAALELLGIEELYCSPLPLARGEARMSHGLVPLPAPVTLEILRGIPVYEKGREVELVTPTGAALVAALASGYGALPSMRLAGLGYGAGTKDLPHPNVLRVIVGEKSEGLSGAMGGEVWGTGDARPVCEKVAVVEAQIDDMNPEFYPYLMDVLFSLGAWDAFLTPVIMKKGRPGNLVTVLVPVGKVGAIVGSLAEETTTLGVRIRYEERIRLAREFITVTTPWGEVKVKLAYGAAGQVVNVAPEFGDCAEVAARSGVPLKSVFTAAQCLAWDKLGKQED